jgi:hypothetical protein
MKATNNKWFAGAMKLAVGLVLAGSFLMPLPVHAQPRYAGNITLAHETRWGTTMIPAGDYKLNVDAETEVIQVCDSNTGKVVANEIGVVATGSRTDRSELRIATRGSEQAVYALFLAQYGEIYSNTRPFPKTSHGDDDARATEITSVRVIQK